ncbi:hypothetical protein B0H14DRAFT_3871686 [Mycena olivaceomarginata]|nr:hypothetical protein B0H14DRAFT_3871686 [Mycena olivaceomarginata]
MRSSCYDPSNDADLYTLLRIDVSSASTPTLTPLTLPFCLPLPAAIRHPPRRHLDVASPPTLGSSCASTATLSLAACPKARQPFHPPLAASSILPAIHPLPSSLPPPHTTLTRIDPWARLPWQYAMSAQTSSRSPASQLEWRVAGFDSTSAASMGAPTPMCPRERRGRRTMMERDTSIWRGRVFGWEAGGIPPKSRLIAVGLRLTPGSSLLCKMVVICLLARVEPSRRSTSTLRWPKVAHASLALTWSSPASCTRAALPLKGFLPVCADAARLPPQRHQLPRPPLGSPRLRRPPPHLLVANAARP